jgi:hypothetical protein
MKTSSAGQPLNRTTARNSFLVNQFATPGLGSLMARRYLAGSGQLLLSVAGFGFVVAWFVSVMARLYQQVEGEAMVTGNQRKPDARSPGKRTVRSDTAAKTRATLTIAGCGGGDAPAGRNRLIGR